MGDRFYMQQAAYKPTRRLKKDIVDAINVLLGMTVSGLDKCTIATLEELETAIEILKESTEE